MRPHILTTPASTHVRATTGEQLPVRTWLPVTKPRRVVVALHGMVTHAGWFATLGDALVERGIALVAPDRRGNGLARGLRDVGNIDLLLADVDVVVAYARELADDVALLSWCGSANFAVPAATRVAVDRFVMASPGLVPLAEMSARFRAAQASNGSLPIHFDPAREFTDDEATRTMIRGDELYLRRIPEPLRDAWKQLNPLARQALRDLRVPTHCVLTRIDRMIDIAGTVELMGDIPVLWTEGGHGFVVETTGSEFVAAVLGEP